MANFLRRNPTTGVVEEAAVPSGNGTFSLAEVEVNLGSVPRRSGRFTVSGLSGLTVGGPLLFTQSAGPYTGKGTRSDEAEVDRVMCSARATSASTVEVYWSSQWRVKGNFKFSYAAG